MQTQKEILDALNDQQKLPVINYKGKSVVIAGAGSGKTATIISRAAYMIQDGVSAESILMFTFTRKGAGEIKERIIKKIGPEGAKITVGTYHSVCGRLLRSYANVLGYKEGFSIYDPSDSIMVMKKIMKEDIDRRVPPYLKVEKVAGIISKFKEKMLTPNAAMSYAVDSGSDDMEYSAEVYKIYQKKLFDCNAMDYDDLIFNTIVILEKYDDIKAAVNKYYKYIIADEVQDSSIRDLKLIELLAGDAFNLCMVGDDAQSIYSFRGANIGAFFDFIKKYGLTQYRLERNYRSTQTIVDAAQELIDHNENQLKKKCFSKNAKGQGIVIQKAKDETEEAVNVAKTVNILKKNGYQGKDIAILYRLNKCSRKVEDAFIKSGIKYKILSGVPFCMRESVRDCMAYLRLIINPLDYAAFMRAINVPKRYIGDVAQKKINNLIVANRNAIMTLKDVENMVLDTCDLNKRQKANFSDFIKVISVLTEYYKNGESAKYIINKLINMIDYYDYAAIYEGGSEGAQNNTQELISIAQEYSSDQIENLVNEIAIADATLSPDNEDIDNDDERVRMLTVHGAKGLEWPVVILIDCHDACFPNLRRKYPVDIEEERRLFYVAMTRAKNNLILTYPTQYISWSGVPEITVQSKFIDELNDKFVYTLDKEAV